MVDRLRLEGVPTPVAGLDRRCGERVDERLADRRKLRTVERGIEVATDDDRPLQRFDHLGDPLHLGAPLAGAGVGEMGRQRVDRDAVDVDRAGQQRAQLPHAGRSVGIADPAAELRVDIGRLDEVVVRRRRQHVER